MKTGCSLSKLTTFVLSWFLWSFFTLFSIIVLFNKTVIFIALRTVSSGSNSFSLDKLRVVLFTASQMFVYPGGREGTDCKPEVLATCSPLPSFESTWLVPFFPPKGCSMAGAVCSQEGLATCPTPPSTGALLFGELVAKVSDFEEFSSGMGGRSAVLFFSLQNWWKSF